MSRKRVRVGMIGAGFISDYHLAGLQAAGASVTSIFSRSGETARDKAQQYGIPHTCDDVSELLDRDDIDAVVIATPDFTHEALAIDAARAGKAILLQKPMARSSSEARRIITAAREGGVPLVVSFMHRYFEEVEQLRELLTINTLGSVHAVRHRNATPGADWASWFYDSNASGGVVMQLGVHGIDLLRQLFGEIEAVKAVTQTSKPERELADGAVVRSDNEDLATALYRFASGLIATHEMSYLEVAGTDRFRTEVYGDRGTAWLRTERGRLAIATGDDGAWRTPELPDERVGERHHRHVLAMLRGDAPIDQSAQDGLASLLVAEAIYRSADAGQWTEVER